MTLLALVVLTGCAGDGGRDVTVPESTLYELINERYIRGPGDTIGSDGPLAAGTTVCTYFNRESGARIVRRYPGALPCPPFD